MDNIIIRNRKEEFKELVLYAVFGNMTFVISIGAYAIFNIFMWDMRDIFCRRNGGTKFCNRVCGRRDCGYCTLFDK